MRWAETHGANGDERPGIANRVRRQGAWAPRHAARLAGTALVLWATVAHGAAAAGPVPARTTAADPPPVLVAVAANFAVPFDMIAKDFTAATGYRVAASIGSTAQLYAQIRNGAPFDVFLAADPLHPHLLETENLAVPGSRFTLAVGRLVLWSADSLRIGTDGRVALRATDLRHLAIANPRTAPYGRAAEQALRALGLWEALAPRLVYGENVAQALQFVESGNAELGFVARAQVLDPRLVGRGSRWDVPAELHDPILQDAVLLVRAASNPAARALVDFLRGPAVLAVLARFGYGLP